MTELPQKTIDLLNTAIADKDSIQLKQLLHTDNKNCRKLFQQATKTKLPKTVMRTNELLDSWCKGEEYIEPIEIVRYKEPPKIFVSKPILHKMLGL